MADLKIESPAFNDRQPIPIEYTCEGSDVPPPLLISGVPSNAKSLVLIVDDPDAPRGTFDHWIAWNIPPNTLRIDAKTALPMEGTNGFGVTAYRGPCPPPGKPHHYFFKLYALRKTLDLAPGSTKAQVEKAMEGQILSHAELVGTYQR